MTSSIGVPAEEVPCEFCGQPVGLEGKGSTTCDRCWYGMRMAPDEWLAELKAEGCTPPIYQGGCIETQLFHEDGSPAGYGIACRSPYVPGLKSVKP